MAVIFPDSLKDPFLFNADRNTWMSGGGVHTWNVSFQWTFTAPMYINWLAGRGLSNSTRRGTANYNQINAQTLTIAADSVAYVTIDPNTDGSVLPITVCLGTALPQGDNVFVLAIHKAGLPLLLRWGNSIPVGGTYDAAAGGPSFGYAGAQTGSLWSVSSATLALSGSTDLVVQCYDSATLPRNVIWPYRISTYADGHLEVEWSTSVSGYLVVMKAK